MYFYDSISSSNNIGCYVHDCSNISEPERSDRDIDRADTIHCSVGCLLVYTSRRDWLRRKWLSLTVQRQVRQSMPTGGTVNDGERDDDNSITQRLLP